MLAMYASRFTDRAVHVDLISKWGQLTVRQISDVWAKYAYRLWMKRETIGTPGGKADPKMKIKAQQMTLIQNIWKLKYQWISSWTFYLQSDAEFLATASKERFKTGLTLVTENKRHTQTSWVQYPYRDNLCLYRYIFTVHQTPRAMYQIKSLPSPHRSLFH